MENKKITVPAEITREWLAQFDAPTAGKSPAEKAEYRIQLFASGAVDPDDWDRIKDAREAFWLADIVRKEREEGDKKTAERIAEFKTAIKLIPQAEEIAKKWAGKVHDRRFYAAFKQVSPDIIATSGSGGDWVEVEYYPRASHHNYSYSITLARVYKVESVLTPFESAWKKRRIDPTKIIEDLRKTAARLEKKVENIERTRREREKAREKIAEIERLKRELREYDADTLKAYNIDVERI